MAKTLPRAVASVADGISEIIIVDDGSDDDTDECIQLLKTTCPDWNIIPVRQDHKGLGYSLNTALALSRAEYIMRQDADDVSYERRKGILRQELNSTYRHSPAVSSWFAHQNTGKVHHGMIHAFPPILTTEDLLSGWRFPHGAAMYRRNALEKVGGWPVDMECCEDHLLHLRLSRLGPLPIVPEVLYFIGNSPDRQTRVKDTALWDAYAVQKFKGEVQQ